jgi:hypothetical protein
MKISKESFNYGAEIDYAADHSTHIPGLGAVRGRASLRYSGPKYQAYIHAREIEGRPIKNKFGVDVIVMEQSDLRAMVSWCNVAFNRDPENYDTYEEV